jgi:hypothetical protein
VPVDAAARRFRRDVLVPATDATRLAVLIDSDNTTASLTTELLAVGAALTSIST